ncbi:MAG: glycoside hydrolase family 9 protein [Bacteroidota bacterium]
MRITTVAFFLSLSWSLWSQDGIHLRVNQLGYLPGDQKVAVVFSGKKTNESFELISAEDQRIVQRFKATPAQVASWGTIPYHYQLDFSSVTTTGSYRLRSRRTGKDSQPFRIGPNVYSELPGQLLEFMRQQRCGYNPFLDMVCHPRDGRVMYSELPDSTFVDASGGWHDAGDQLKYLITASYATGHMLMAYELFPDAFGDEVNDLGQPGANGIADVLDEAKWGMDWIMKLHFAPNQLIHQVADDRDHRGWKMPDDDISDYGWGPNSYRVAYVATGEPQGLGKYKSKATGFANVAGRSAAALALGARVWRDLLGDEAMGDQYLAAAKSLYALGRENEGYQQGNSYGAPYRYNEETWADDMEWAAAELLKTTGEEGYRVQAMRYAREANTISWMNQDSASHYQYYPFVNLGHYALYDQVPQSFQDTLANYYRNGIEYTKQRAERNPYGIGVPFIWCSNNLLTSLMTQVILYEEMTEDKQYHSFLVDQREWLFGRNPWGTSMFTGVPASGEYPLDVHTSVYVMTGEMVPGGLVDGPIYHTIHSLLKGLVLLKPDEFAEFQNGIVTYHDDVGDYSTNEPTMDGTAGSMIMAAYWATQGGD